MEVKWANLRLATNTGGSTYAADAVKVEVVIQKLSQPVSGDSRPAVVWFYKTDDEEANGKLESDVFVNEQVGLSLKQFRRYRVDIDRIPSEKIRKLYERTPAFRFFDPAGESLGKLEGKRATSLKGFTRLVEKTWAKTFTVSLRAYTKPMTKILDRLAKLGQKRTILAEGRARLAKKPNARKQREFDRDQELLDAEEEKIQRDEQKIIALVKLKDEYLPETEDKTARK